MGADSFANENREIPSRICLLREHLFALKENICWERAKIVTRSRQRTTGDPVDLQTAEALYDIFNELPIFIQADELIVGQRAALPGARSMYPEFSLDGVNEPDIPSEVLIFWKGRTLKDRVTKEHPPELRKAEAELAAGYCTGTGSGYGHVIVDYEKVLHVGFEGVVAEAECLLRDTPVDDAEGRVFLRAVIRASRGVIRWAERYAELAEKEAREATTRKRCDELNRIASICRKVPARPARTFYEALQSFWFTHLAMHMEQQGWSISAGRFDQYMYRYYQLDIENGLASQEEQWELLLSLWIKFMENIGSQPLRTVFQNLTLAGQNEDGSDAVNDLSFMCLHATALLKLNQPALSVRWHPGISPAFWKEVHLTIATGIGMPALFNDSVIVPALERHGVEKQDARNYGIVGCVEASVPGKEQGVTAGGHINMAKAMELALNDGVSMITGERIGPATGDAAFFKTFTEFRDAYAGQVRYLSDLNMKASILAGREQKGSIRYPLMSSLLSDCLEKRRDLVYGSTRYNLPGIAIFGPSNTYDGFHAIRTLVFEQARITMNELCRALKANFCGFEHIQEILLNMVSKFGNDDDKADAAVNQLNALHADYCKTFTDARNGRFVCGVWPVESHVYAGKWTGATPDGRNAGMPLVDGVGACQGADRHGPSALLKSVAKLDNVEHWPAGNTCNIKFTPAFVRASDGLDSMVALSTSFMRLGGQELQINVVDKQILLEAQSNPELHRDLIVRVAGFSAFFTTLSSDTQNEIISRHEYTRWGPVKTAVIKRAHTKNPDCIRQND